MFSQDPPEIGSQPMVWEMLLKCYDQELNMGTVTPGLGAHALKYDGIVREYKVHLKETCTPAFNFG